MSEAVAVLAFAALGPRGQWRRSAANIEGSVKTVHPGQRS